MTMKELPTTWRFINFPETENLDRSTDVMKQSMILSEILPLDKFYYVAWNGFYFTWKIECPDEKTLTWVLLKTGARLYL